MKNKTLLLIFLVSFLLPSKVMGDIVTQLWFPVSSSSFSLLSPYQSSMLHAQKRRLKPAFPECRLKPANPGMSDFFLILNPGIADFSLRDNKVQSSKFKVQSSFLHSEIRNPKSEIRRKSPGLAFGLSFLPEFVLFSSGILLKEDSLIGVTFLTMTLFGSAGHVYTGEYRHAIKQTSIRVAGAVVTFVGAGLFTMGLVEGVFSGIFERDNDKAGEQIALGILLFLFGATVVTISYVYDVIDSPFSAIRHNRAHGNESSFKIRPTVKLSENGNILGMVFKLEF